MGYSSRELTAAYTAGYSSKEDTLKAAFYRSQAAKYCCCKAKLVPVGMLAVGLGSEEAARYISGSTDTAQIACFNCPNSVTLSETLSSSEDVKARLVKDGHFARLLQVNLAYHSRYMS